MISKTTYDSYFNGFNELRHFSSNTALVNAIALMKILSYFTLVIPIAFIFMRYAPSLIGRVSPQSNENTQNSPKDALSRITDDEAVEMIQSQCANGAIPNLSSLNSQATQAEQDDMDTLFNPGITFVLKDLYLGNQRDAGVLTSLEPNKEARRQEIEADLRERNISTIITCCEQKIGSVNQFQDITYIYQKMGDTRNNEEFINSLPDVLLAIHQARSEGRSVLIHCNAGSSRSAACVIAYLMALGLSFDEAYRYLKSQRLIVNISNFESTLQALDQEQLTQMLAGSAED